MCPFLFVRVILLKVLHAMNSDIDIFVNYIDGYCCLVHLLTVM